MNYLIKKIFILIIVFTVLFIFAMNDSHEIFSFDIAKNNVREYLKKELVITHHPNDSKLFFKPNNNAYIYVLGGTQASLKSKFQVVAELYNTGKAEIILILNSDGITAYDDELDRNLTNNEWALKELKNLGIDKKNIIFIEIEPYFFGTLSEAKTMANISSKFGIQRLYLVCSSYHGRRVLATFSALFDDIDVEFAIHANDEGMRIPGLLQEYGKTILYEYVLLPYKTYKI